MSSSSVQSVLFPVNDYTVAQARKWLQDHDFVHDGKVDTTTEFHRFRQEEPGRFSRFRTKKVAGGIRLVLGFVTKKKARQVKGRGTMTMAPPSRKQLEQMAKFVHHFGVMASDDKMGKLLAQGASPQLSKALSTMARLVVSRDGSEMGGKGISLDEKTRGDMMKLARASSHAERMKVMRGRGFLSSLKKGARVGFDIFKVVAPIALQLAPLISRLLA